MKPCYTASDRRCISHTSDASLVAKRYQGRAAGGRESLRRMREKRAQDRLERVPLHDEAAIRIYLGRGAALALREKDPSHALAAAKVGEVVFATLGMDAKEAENRKLREENQRLRKAAGVKVGA